MEYSESVGDGPGASVELERACEPLKMTDWSREVSDEKRAERNGNGRGALGKTGPDDELSEQDTGDPAKEEK